MKFVEEKKFDSNGNFSMQPGFLYKIKVKKDYSSRLRKGTVLFLFCLKKEIGDIEENIYHDNLEPPIIYTVINSKQKGANFIISSDTLSLMSRKYFQYFRAEKS